MTGEFSRRSALQAIATAPLLGWMAHAKLLRQDPAPMELRVRHAPTPRPDRLVLTWASDPTTAVTANWRTDTSVNKGFCEVMRAAQGPSDKRTAQRVEAATAPFATGLGDCHMHKARLSGLDPDTRYQYRVGDGANWSEWNHFRTAPAKGDSFKFVYLGDTQNDIEAQASRVARAAMLDCPDALFVAHGGDLVDRSINDHEWGEWFRAYTPFAAMWPQICVPGNHDYDPGAAGGPRVLTRYWTQLFDYPPDAVAGLSQSVYAIDVLGMRLICLNSMERLADQVPFLEQQLSSAGDRWKVVMFHHPVYSSGNARTSDARRDLLEPVFSKHNADLILQGHDHTYARTGLVSAGQAATDRGPVYLTSVAGPKMYRLTLSPLHRSGAAQSQLYQIVTVNKDRIKLEAKTALGEVHDAFEIVRESGGRKRLVEAFAPRIYNPS